MRIPLFGDYIIYVDESGDHSFSDNYVEHPVFVLAFCIFKKNDYHESVRFMNEVKFEFWGNDLPIFHSHSIRKQIKEFSLLANREAFTSFLSSLTSAIQKCPFTIIATAVDKRLLTAQYAKPYNPYHLALEYCMERTYKFLEEKEQSGRKTPIIIEARGNKEDKELNIEFQNLLVSKKGLSANYPCELIFSEKKTNNIGLQLADLAAYPIGRYAVEPQKDNKPFKILLEKFHKFPEHLGKGLKIFPLEVHKFQILPEKRKTPDHSEVNAD